MINTKILTYTVKSKIGEGGMGSVYLGIHQNLDRKAAIKVLNPELSNNAELIKRFHNEAITLSKLNHQNIVSIYDFVDSDGKYFLIMEYAEGDTLDIIIEKRGPIGENTAIKLFGKVLDGFSYAHQKGIIHRDIKPSNIIVGTDNEIKILDFGIAKILESGNKLTKTGTRMGSINYMSPEQILARDVDTRSDVYSLGVTLFEMLSGSLPYNSDNESEYEIQTRILKEPLPSILQINQNISSNTDFVIQKATSKDPNQRFRSCEEFKNSLLGGIKKDTIRSSQTMYQKPEYTRISEAPVKNVGNRNILIGGLIIIILLISALLFYLLSNQTSEPKNILSNEQNRNKSVPPVEKIPETPTVTAITVGEAKSFINKWQAYQNNKQISDYLSLYSSDFSGIKRTKSGKTYYLNYSQWVSDRSAMYSKAINLYIGVYDVKVNIENSGNTAKVSFQQTYSSNQYSDEGIKIVKLKRNSNGELAITNEELIYSTETFEGD